MGGRLGRFLRLEGPRKPGDPGESGDPKDASTQGRFGHIGAADTAAKGEGESSSTGSTGPMGASANEARPAEEGSSSEISARFSGEAPPMALETTSTIDISFRRCWQCSSDSGRYADVCQNCGVSLETPGQRAFEEVFAKKWAEQRAAEQGAAAQDAAARAEAGEAARHAAMPQIEKPPRPGSGEELPPITGVSIEEQRRRLGEMLAQQVRRQVELEWSAADGGNRQNRWMVEVETAGRPIRVWLETVEPFWLRLGLRLLFGFLPLLVLGFGLWVLARYFTCKPITPLFVGAGIFVAAVVVVVYVARQRRL